MTGNIDDSHCENQGLLTGRSPVELLLTRTSLEQLQAGYAATWNATVGAAASCDTALITERGAELITTTELWHVRTVRAQGTDIVRPFLLARDLHSGTP